MLPPECRQSTAAFQQRIITAAELKNKVKNTEINSAAQSVRSVLSAVQSADSSSIVLLVQRDSKGQGKKKLISPCFCVSAISADRLQQAAVGICYWYCSCIITEAFKLHWKLTGEKKPNKKANRLSILATSDCIDYFVCTANERRKWLSGATFSSRQKASDNNL